jgi:NhaA family Na+:H+ antiporter
MRDPRRQVPVPLRLPAAMREYLREEAAGGIALMAAAAVALAWANSPWRAAYAALWDTRLAVQLGRFSLEADLRHWVNEGLMALFFLVVGLEIKRELVVGELRSWRSAALPVVAAAAGMALPAALYAAVNAGGPGAAGWGVPMATDIAFALGLLALLGPRVPPALKVFLLTLAVVDDLGSILVVALFYSQGVHLAALAAAAGLLLLVAGLVRARVWWPPVHVALGLALWLALWRAGVSWRTTCTR